MTKRFTLSQNGTFHTVRDNVENKPLGVFEFKENEFPAYACFHMIIDLMNNLSDENENLKSENEDMRRLIDDMKRLIDNISYQRDEFHRGARENANRVGKLKKENEQLKQTCQMVEDTYHALQKKFHNWDIALDKCRNENKKLKQTNQRLNDELQECMGKLALKR